MHIVRIILNASSMLCWQKTKFFLNATVNPLNAELNPICHLLALLGGATIVVVSRLKVNHCALDS